MLIFLELYTDFTWGPWGGGLTEPYPAQKNILLTLLDPCCRNGWSYGITARFNRTATDTDGPSLNAPLTLKMIIVAALIEKIWNFAHELKTVSCSPNEKSVNS